MGSHVPELDRGRVGRVVGEFLRGGLRTPEDDEARRRLAMFNVISAIGVATCIPLGFSAWSDGVAVLGILDHIVAAFLVANLWFLRKTGKYYVAAGAGLSVVAALFLYLILTGGIEGTGHLWFYTFPLISAFLLGSRAGAVSSLAMLVSATTFLVLGADRFAWVHSYDREFLVRFVPSYFTVLAYAYYFERFREENHRALRTRNAELREAREDLERRVDERTAELRQSKELFTTVLNSIDANVYVADIDSHEILFTNRRMVEAFGEDLVGTQCYESLRGQRAPCPECTNPRLLDANGEPTGVVVWEGRNQRSSKWYMHHDRAVEWIDGRHVRLQVATDLTERKEAEEERERLQEQLSQAQRMEAIGTLAGGVAHDLNNILSAIIGYPDLLLKDLDPDSHLRAPLVTLKESGLKCSRIVADLLTLARSGVSESEPVSLTSVVEKFLDSPEFVVTRSRHPGVEVVTDLDAATPVIAGSEVVIFKVLLNLVINAFEAMPAGGRLDVRTRSATLDRARMSFTTIPPGEYAMLSVADTGVGIPTDDLPRIFEPFYSRKSVGQSGSGLGLAVVWGAIVDHQGHIDVRTTPGAGTRFDVYLPVPDRLPPAESSATGCPEGAGEMVLIVDDLEEQRVLASEILDHLGYVTRTAASGEEAEDMVRREPPDLMLLDMVMEPGIDGLETFRRARAIRPDQKAIIVSGYSQTERVEEAQRLGVGGCVTKPYLVHELATAVRRELDR